MEPKRSSPGKEVTMKKAAMKKAISKVQKVSKKYMELHIQSDRRILQ